MSKPTEGSLLARKLAKVSLEVACVQKDSVNEFHKYKYASAAAVLSKVNEALGTRNISISSGAELLSYEQGMAIVRLTLRFVDGDTGEVQAVQGLGQGSDKGDKAVMKANTAAIKYAYANAFNISWGDDPEADATTDKPKRKKRHHAFKKAGPTEEGFKTAFTFDEITAAILSCSTHEELAATKGQVVTMRGTEHYKPLIGVFKTKEKELNG